MDRKTVAAIVAAIMRYLEEEGRPSSQNSPWLLAGRREQLLRREPHRWYQERREVYERSRRKF